MVHFYLNSNCSPVTFDLIINDENGPYLTALLLSIASLAFLKLLTFTFICCRWNKLHEGGIRRL